MAEREHFTMVDFPVMNLKLSKTAHYVDGLAFISTVLVIKRSPKSGFSLIGARYSASLILFLFVI